MIKVAALGGFALPVSGDKKTAGQCRPFTLPAVESLLGGFLRFVGHRLRGIGSTLCGFGGGIGSRVTGSRGGFTRGLDSGTRCVGRSVSGFRGGVHRCAGCFLRFFHGGGGSFFRFLAGAQCERGEKCNEKFGLHH